MPSPTALALSRLEGILQEKFRSTIAKASGFPSPPGAYALLVRDLVAQGVLEALSEPAEGLTWPVPTVRRGDVVLVAFRLGDERLEPQDRERVRVLRGVVVSDEYGSTVVVRLSGAGLIPVTEGRRARVHRSRITSLNNLLVKPA